MVIPIIVLCSRHPAMRSTFEALAQSGLYEIHAVVGIEIDRRYGIKYLASITMLPPHSHNNDSQVIHTILSLAKQVRAKALLPVWSEDVALVAKNHDKLIHANPVPIPQSKLLEQLVNKLYFIRLANSLGLPTPRTIEMNPTLDIQETINLLGLPMLAKPVIGSGGIGIIEVTNISILKNLLKNSSTGARMILQEKVLGEDVALTLLAEKGKVFSVMIRKRWFTRRKSPAFSPMYDIEFLDDSWLEELGREFVRLTQFSGIADFDLKVDFESRRAWFLESDPRMMGRLSSVLRFGLNIPMLLVEQTRGKLPNDICVRPKNGYFLSLRSIPEWIVRAGWRKPRSGSIHTNLSDFMSDPISKIHGFLLSLIKTKHIS